MQPGKPLLAALTFFMLLSSCNNSNKTEEKQKTDPLPEKSDFTFIYEYGDSSVPPEYHRSYSITVTPGLALLVVDSYGDVLLRDSSVLDTKTYQTFAASLLSLKISTKKPEESEGCDGGTTDKLVLFVGTPEEIKGDRYHCAGKTYGSLSGDVDGAIGLFRSLVPSIEDKIRSSKRPN